MPQAFGPPVYKVHVSVCHWTGGPLPAAGESPAYAQLYIYDPAEALQTRISHNPETNAKTMKALRDELAAENCYAQSYTHMYQLLQEVKRLPRDLVNKCQRSPCASSPMLCVNRNYTTDPP